MYVGYLDLINENYRQPEQKTPMQYFINSKKFQENTHASLRNTSKVISSISAPGGFRLISLMPKFSRAADWKKKLNITTKERKQT